MIQEFLNVDISFIFQYWYYLIWIILVLIGIYVIALSKKGKASVTLHSNKKVAQVTEYDQNDNIISISNYNSNGKLESMELIECQSTILKKHIYCKNKLIQTEYYIQSAVHEPFRKTIVFNGLLYRYKDCKWHNSTCNETFMKTG